MSNSEQDILNTLASIEKLTNQSKRAQQLAKLAPELITTDSISQALKIASGISNPAACAFVLSKLSSCLNSQQTLLKAFVIACNISLSKSRVSAISKLSSKITPDFIPEAIVMARELILTKSYFNCTELLVAILPKTPSEFLPEILTIACEIDDEETNKNRIQKLIELEETLKKFSEPVNTKSILYRDYEQANDTASQRALENEQIDRNFCYAPRCRAKLLALLFYYFEGEQRAQIFEKLLETIEEIPAQPCKANSLLALAQHLPKSYARRVVERGFMILKEIIQDIDNSFEDINSIFSSFDSDCFIRIQELENQLNSITTETLWNETLYILQRAEQILFRNLQWWEPNMMKGLPPDSIPSSPRYINVGFYSFDNTEENTEKPLALNIASYILKINIGIPWGISSSDTAIPEELLKPFFEKEDTLEMDVVVHSFDVQINSSQQKIKLSKTGDSAFLDFPVIFTRTKRHSIDVDLLFHGHLLQSKRIEVYLVEKVGDIPPESAFPVQDAYVTFTRTATLNPGDLEHLKDKPRKLTIVAERDIDFNRIGLRFYDTEGTDLGFQQSTLTEAKLTKALTAVRKQLLKTMNAYSGTLGSTEAVLTKHLGQLAVIGRKFYLALLPGLDYQEEIHDERQRLNVDLKSETVIQVAPLSSSIGVPWELLYERKIESYQEGRIKLCPTWHQHGSNPEDCPSYGTEEEEITVCPHSFWGYSYIIEQLPCKLETHKPLPKHSLPLFIRNNLPLLLNTTVFNNFKQLASHWEELEKLSSANQLQLLRTDSREKFKEMIKNYATNSADILYFYTHGGIDEFDDSPFLTIGNGEKIQLIDLDAWDTKFDKHQPLVVLNACDTADYTPDNFENLLQFFCDRGAAGVIGTQCEVKEKLANAFIVNFFQYFLQQNPAGEALFKSRHSLLREHLDPRGLAYSLFASADVKLAQPVVNSTITIPSSK